MAKSAYFHMTKTWQKTYKREDPELWEWLRQQAIKWRRKGVSMFRVDKPIKPHRARQLGYKAKTGFIIVRIRVRKGGARKPRPRSGRKPSHMGAKKFTRHISLQKIAEQRVARKYPNLEVVGSYLIIDDGIYKWYDVILRDPQIIREPPHK